MPQSSEIERDHNQDENANAEPANNGSSNMQKKPKAPIVKFIIQLLSCLLMVELLCLPLFMLIVDGPDETQMSNEAKTEVEAFSISGFLSGTFQSNFESWFSGHYPLRSDVVRSYKQGVYDVDNLAFLKGDKETVEDWEIDTSIGSVETDEEGNEVIIIPMTPIETKPSNTQESIESGETESGKTTIPTETETQEDDYNYYFDLHTNPYAYINTLQAREKILEPTGTHGTNRVAVGKSGYLFEFAYMQEYLGFANTPYTTYSSSALQETVNKLTYIQDQLLKRGIGFVFVISSSKASQYADYIPDWYINANKANIVSGYVRAYDALIPMLEKSTLNYVDSKQLFEEKGLLVTFPKTGIHWNKLAAFEATKQALLQLEAQTGIHVRHMEFDKIKAQTSPFGYGNHEQDIFGILYNELGDRTGAITDTYYFAPSIEIDPATADYANVNVLIQGGSFCHDIVSFIRGNVGQMRQIYYNWSSYSDWIDGSTSSSDNVLFDNENWEKLLADIDYVMFEATEQQLATIAWGAGGHAQIYASLYNYLRAHEIK